MTSRAVSSVGRASRLHRECRGFESCTAHHPASFWYLRCRAILFLVSDRVNLWFGRATGKKAFNAFFKETYSDDDRPISPFAESQGETFYDHDFLETHFNAKLRTTNEALMAISFSSSFADSVRDLVSSFDYNFSVAAFSDDFSAPRSVEAEGLSLTYIGTFEYDQKAKPVGEFDHLGHVYLHVLGGHKLELEGELTDCIRVDAYGLMIGLPSPYGRYLDLSKEVPFIGGCQLRISVDQNRVWELRDFGNNNLTVVEGVPLNNSFLAPEFGLRFAVGEVEFLWADSPKELLP